MNPITEQYSSASRILEKNVQALVNRNRQEEAKESADTKIAAKITRVAGTLRFFYFHVLIYSTWIILNLGWFGFTPFDKTLAILAMIASSEALFMTTFILISQNRLTRKADKRADLDVQISLLTEHEVTRLMTLVIAIAQKLQVIDLPDEELKELAKDTEAEEILNALEKNEEQPCD